MKYIMQNSDSNYRQVIDTIINNKKKKYLISLTVEKLNCLFIYIFMIVLKN